MNIILFNHIPKTGGRAIARHLRNNLDKFHDTGNYSDIDFKNTRHNLQKDNKRFESPNNFIFTILRHPYERYVSAINHLHTFPNTKKNFIDGLHETKKNVALDMDLIINLPDIRRNHLIFRDQTKHIRLLNHDYIHRYDKPLSDIVVKINERYNMDFPLEIDKFNVSKQIFKVSDLTEEQKSKIHKIYKTDFEIYDTV